MLNPIFDFLRQSDPYEQLIASVILFESQPKTDLQTRRRQEESFKSVLEDLDSKTSALHSLLGTFTDTTTNPFATKRAIVPENSSFSVSVTDAAGLGSHSVEVEQLAATDSRVSSQYNRSGNQLRSFFDANGSQTFSINVASPTDEDKDNRVAVEVTVDATGTTNEEILGEISNAINDAFDQAVADGTIRGSERAQASTITETSDTIRLSFRSGNTGFQNRLEFTDSGAGLLDATKITLNSVFDPNGSTPATSAELTGTTISAPIQIQNSNRKLDIIVNGEERNVRIEKTTYDTLEDLAAAVNDAIGNDVVVTVDQDKLRITTVDDGADSSLQIIGGNSLATLGLTAMNDPVTGTDQSGGAGMIFDVGTSETDSALSSRVVLDGLTIYRSTNQIADAIAGITISLEETSETAEDFTIDTDSDSIRSEIDSFVSNYNDMMSFVADQMSIDGDLGIRSALANDSTILNLRLSLRTDLAREVTGQPLDAPTFLTQIGISINDDGTLEISDEDKLVEAVTNDASAVQSLFAGTDGIATRMEQRLESYVGTSSIFDRRIESVDTRIDRLDDRIVDFDERIGRRETQLREQFARLQETLAVLEGQQQFLGLF